MGPREKHTHSRIGDGISRCLVSLGARTPALACESHDFYKIGTNGAVAGARADAAFLPSRTHAQAGTPHVPSKMLADVIAPAASHWPAAGSVAQVLPAAPATQLSGSSSAAGGRRCSRHSVSNRYIRSSGGSGPETVRGLGHAAAAWSPDPCGSPAGPPLTPRGAWGAGGSGGDSMNAAAGAFQRRRHSQVQAQGPAGGSAAAAAAGPEEPEQEAYNWDFGTDMQRERERVRLATAEAAGQIRYAPPAHQGRKSGLFGVGTLGIGMGGSSQGGSGRLGGQTAAAMLAQQQTAARQPAAAAKQPTTGAAAGAAARVGYYYKGTAVGPGDAPARKQATGTESKASRAAEPSEEEQQAEV
eukprot:XP_001701205.1 predicted protein [Chlamydomonas reinhardtii]